MSFRSPLQKEPFRRVSDVGRAFRSPQISTTQIFFLSGAVCRTIAQAGPVFHFLSFFTHFSAIFSLGRKNHTPASPWSPIRPSPPCSTGGPSGRCWNTAPSTAYTPSATARWPAAFWMSGTSVSRTPPKVPRFAPTCPVQYPRSFPLIQHAGPRLSRGPGPSLQNRLYPQAIFRSTLRITRPERGWHLQPAAKAV